MPFDSPDYDLDDILDDIAVGNIQLPDFQREWKWDDDRIASLLASISLGYPVGVVMLLEVGGADGIRFAPKVIAGVDGSKAGPPEHLLLDGQQRLTSLFQALRSGAPVNTTDTRGKKLKRWYYIDIVKAIDPDGDREEAILSVPEDRVVREDFGRTVIADYSTADGEIAGGVFPLDALFDTARFTDWQTNFLTGDPSAVAERRDVWLRLTESVLKPFQSYKLPAIILKRDTPKEAVCAVFEKVNTGGVALNVFELLTATFAAEDFRLKDDWEARCARLAMRPVLRALESTDFLQAITLLATFARRQAFTPLSDDSVAPGVSCKRRDVLRLTLSDYQRWADDVTVALEWAAGFLAEERIFAAADIPYRSQLVPLAAIKVVLGAQADNVGSRNKLRQWFWCGVLGELYGGTTETRFARDLEQVVPWVANDGPWPGTVTEASFQAGRLLTMRTRNSAAYKGVYALLMRQECRDWIKGQPLTIATFYDLAIDIHHIFPKIWCERNEIDKTRRESIVNKTALSYATNRSIGGRSPAEYMPLLEHKAGVPSSTLDEIVGSHLIEPATLREADFDRFFEARTDTLVDLISEAMGKAVVRDDHSGEGDANAFDDQTPSDDLEGSEIVVGDFELTE